MKKLTLFFTIVLVLSTVALSFTACVKPSVDSEGTMTLVVGETEYIVDLSKIDKDKGVISIIEYLNETENLEYELTDSVYGAYYTQIGEIKQDIDTNTYLYFYTSVESDFDVSEYAKSMTYKGKTLMSAGVGATGMSVLKDCVILVTTIVY